MIFLDIAKRVRQEAGYSGDGPATVQGQSGVYRKVVDWVIEAADDISLMRQHWRFNWARLSVALTPGQAENFLAEQWGLEFSALAPDPAYVYRTTDGSNARTWLAVVSWDEMRSLSSANTTGLPIYCALSPNGALHLHPAPMAGLTLVLDYYRLPQVLKENLDVPRIPAHYHMAIVWKAVAKAAAHDENQVLLQTANKQFADIIARMERTELPSMMGWEALA